MAEAVAILALSVLLVVQAVIGARRSEADSRRLERYYKLSAAETPAERISALMDRTAVERTPRDPDRPYKPIGL